MIHVCFRFYEELNDYLPEELRKVWFDYSFPDHTLLKEAILSIGISIDNIDLILVNQQSKGFDYLLHNGDRISVFPVFESFNLSGVTQLRENPLRNPKFVCDVHLGKLCKYLRMLGWDTLYSSQYTTKEIIAISRQEKRTILSRNQKLTRSREVTHSYWIRSADPHEQINDLIRKLDLTTGTDPLTRCLKCNNKLLPVSKQEILPLLLPLTAKYYAEFLRCPVCSQVYWKGSHFENMLKFIHHLQQELTNPL